jgi:MFS family permease
MQFICMPFLGRLSDRIGRRPILLISLTDSAIGYLIWGFSSSLGIGAAFGLGFFVAPALGGFGVFSSVIELGRILVLTLTPGNALAGL